ncbi:MAG: HIT family protein [Gammaproteobacteria bacterium]|nr:HIT family protein [Gammaproteobacteria bacterium]
MSFNLDPRLANSCFKIIDLPLSEVLLKNNQLYPWIILVPRVEDTVTEIFQLAQKKQSELMNELSHISKCMDTHFKPDKLNIGALGNIVSQLHIHIIARFRNDLLWPHSLWQEQLTEEKYSNDAKEKIINELRMVFK